MTTFEEWFEEAWRQGGIDGEYKEDLRAAAHLGWNAVRAAQPGLRDALQVLIEAAEAYQRYHDEKFYQGAALVPTGLRPAIAAARKALA